MTTAFTKTIIAATLAVSTLTAATGNAFATSHGLSYGTQVQQNCYQKPVTVTKYVKVLRYNKWVQVPQKVTEYQTVCDNYHAPAHGAHSGHQQNYQSGY